MGLKRDEVGITAGVGGGQGVRLSPQARAAVDAALDAEVDSGRLPGIVALLLCDGEIIWSRSVGFADAARTERLSPRSIFRIYSMTKLLTCSLAMILRDEGRIRLDDRVDLYLPALSRLTVLRDDGTATPTTRPLTIRDLMRQTSGISGGQRGTVAVLANYRRAGVALFEMTARAYETTTAQLVEALSDLPLACEPGTAWEYGLSTDVLGHLLEVVAAKPLDVLMTEKIARPLGLQDTGFALAGEGDASRLAQPSSMLRDEGTLVVPTRRPTYLSGGSGCLSTPLEYARFLAMLAGHGGSETAAPLQPRSASEIVSDQLGSLRMTGPDYIPGPSYGFGFGLAVGQIGAEDVAEPALYWLGRASTNFLILPRRRVIAVFMTQAYDVARHYQRWFSGLIMGLLRESTG